MPLQDLESYLGKAGVELETPTLLSAWLSTMDGVRQTSYRQQLQEELPENLTLPPEVDEFLQNLEGQDDLSKIALVNSYVNSYISPLMTGQKDSFEFQEVVNLGHGDCTNFATMKAGLLRLAGIDDANITYASGDVTYSCEYNSNDGQGSGPSTAPMRHAFIMVQHEDSFYVLDNNLSEIVALNTDMTGHFDTNGMMEATEHNTVSINSITTLVNLDSDTSLRWSEWKRETDPAMGNDSIGGQTMGPNAPENSVGGSGMSISTPGGRSM